MSELELTALAEVRAIVRKRLDAHDRRERMAPLHEAMRRSLELSMTNSVDHLASVTADSRRSLLAMEKSQADWPEKLCDLEARQAKELARVRRRTDALRRWLEETP